MYRTTSQPMMISFEISKKTPPYPHRLLDIFEGFNQMFSTFTGGKDEF